MRTIDAETLRRWLDEGLPVTVLDVRRGMYRAEWSIPGSIHVDAYRRLSQATRQLWPGSSCRWMPPW